MHPHDPEWLNELVEYARFVRADGVVEQVWLQGVSGITSIISPYELVEQILGDMHAHEGINYLKERGKIDRVVTAAERFVNDIERLEDALPQTPNSMLAEKVLASHEWDVLTRSAKRLIELYPEF